METKSKTTIFTPHKQHVMTGVVFMILSALSYSLMSLIGKLIDNEVSTTSIIFSRFLISLILILPWAIKNFHEIIPVAQPLKLFLRSVCSLIGFGSFFYSLNSLSLTNALLLYNTFPLFIPLVVLCYSKTKTPPRMWIGIILGFLGVIFVLDPEPHFFKLGSLYGLCSGVFSALAIVLIRSLTKMNSVLQILFYNFLICSILIGVLLPFDWKPLNAETLLLLLGVGICGATFQFFSTLAFAKAPVRITSPLMFLCVIFGLIADFAIWDQVPSVLTFIGVIFVILGGILTIYFGQKDITSKAELK